MPCVIIQEIIVYNHFNTKYPESIRLDSQLKSEYQFTNHLTLGYFYCILKRFDAIPCDASRANNRSSIKVATDDLIQVCCGSGIRAEHDVEMRFTVAISVHGESSLYSNSAASYPSIGSVRCRKNPPPEKVFTGGYTFLKAE